MSSSTGNRIKNTYPDAAGGKTLHADPEGACNQPALGILVIGKSPSGEVDQYHVSLEADRRIHGRYRLKFDFGVMELARSKRTGRALSRSSTFSVGVEVVAGPLGEPRLVVRDARMLNTVREMVAGRFDAPGKSPLAVEMVVLAIAGIDTRGLDGQIRFIDGNPLNCTQANLTIADGALPIARQLDDLAHLATVPDGYCRDDFRPYLLDILAVLQVRYQRITSKVRISEAVAPKSQATGQEDEHSLSAADDEGRMPYFEAVVTVYGRDQQDRVLDKQQAKIQASNPYDAWFFGEMEAIRRLLFFGYDVAYCGTLLKKGRLRVELWPKDLSSGTYRLVVTFDRRSSFPWWEPRQVQLPEKRYEMDAVLEPRKDSFTPFLLVTGIHEEIKQAYGKFLDFSKTVRLHRFVLALDEVSMLDAAGDLKVREECWPAIAPNIAKGPHVHVVIPEDPDHPGTGGTYSVPATWTPKPYPFDDSEVYHGHHMFALRHWNHRWQLSRKTERRHEGTHKEWRETLNYQGDVDPEKRKEDKTFVRLIREITHGSLSGADDVELHAHVDSFLRQERWKNTRRKWSHDEQKKIDAIHSICARIDGKQTISRILRSIQEAGSAIPLPALIKNSLVTESQARRWLKVLVRDALITIDNDALVRISGEVPAPFPIPRQLKRPNGKRRRAHQASEGKKA